MIALKQQKEPKKTTTTDQHTMIEDSSKLNKYLKRIQYPENADTNPTLETLTRLHHAHVFNIPFENTHIHMNIPISTNSDDIYDKIVNRGRGGYCFETNQLFADMIQLMGFSFKQLAARVLADSDRDHPSPLVHQITLVEIMNDENNKYYYMCDVGFGGYSPIIEPLPLVTNCPVDQLTNTYQFEYDEQQLGYILQWKYTGRESWKDLYCFHHLREYLPVDYAMMSYYESTHPDSLFTNNLFISLPTIEGVKCLFGNVLSIRKYDVIESRRIESDEECRNVLDTVFHLPVPDDTHFEKLNH